MTQIASVIVVRKGSKRLPKKMHADFGGCTLLEHKLRQLSDVKSITQIYVGSDDEDIIPVVKKYGAIFCRRPDEFCDEVSSTPNDMIKNMLSFFGSDLVLWNHITNPLCTAETYEAAIQQYLKMDQTRYDSVVGVSELTSHFWYNNCRPIRPEVVPLNFSLLDTKHKVAREIPHVYNQNGSIFIRPYTEMAKDGRFLGYSPNLFKMTEIEGWDIDEEWQLDCARAMYQNRKNYATR